LTPSGLLQAKRGDIVILDTAVMGHVALAGIHETIWEVDFRRQKKEVKAGIPITMVCKTAPSKTIWKNHDGRGAVGPSPMFDVFDLPNLRLNYLVFLSPEQPKE
ncbi:hypothetical protein KBC75_05250, partial [Candidatus Shapirobacteria bacterium]|nr:hypothetical protein [Candidatus Shapirobacteria bacterium]